MNKIDLSIRLILLATPLVKKTAARLLTGTLSGLASLGINKLFGSGQQGGILIPDSKVKQLIQYKEYLTAKQTKNIRNALQTGSGVHIKPTNRETASGLGSILLSIAAPMLLDSILGKAHR